MNDPGTTRLRLIAAAREVFTRKGFDAASVREITGDAGANLGAITYHFGSKQALYDAVLEDAFAPLAGVLQQARAATGAPPLDRIERIVRAVFDKLAGTPDLPLLIIQQAVRQSALPGPAQRALGQVLGVLVELIRAGQGQGSIREGDPMLLAVSIWAQPVYFGLLRRLAPDRLLQGSGGVPAIGAMADHAVAFIRRGLAPASED
jgi:TetR/AcrR family transcriptional regulator, regulator of cefoperazone and chloramphenicol sensitivity